MWCAQDISRELTGQRRNRVFVYDAYLNILNEGVDPADIELALKRLKEWKNG